MVLDDVKKISATYKMVFFTGFWCPFTFEELKMGPSDAKNVSEANINIDWELPRVYFPQEHIKKDMQKK